MLQILYKNTKILPLRDNLVNNNFYNNNHNISW